MPLLFAVCVGVITVMSMIPSTTLPNALDFWDKAQHALAFAVLTVTGSIAYPDKRTRTYIGLLLLAVGIELIQKYFTTTHVGDVLDLLADGVGGMLGIIIYALLRRWIQNKTTQ